MAGKFHIFKVKKDHTEGRLIAEVWNYWSMDDETETPDYRSRNDLATIVNALQESCTDDYVIEVDTYSGNLVRWENVDKPPMRQDGTR